MILTEKVTNDKNESYEVLKEDIFLSAMEIIKGQYYDDEIRSIEDLENIFKTVITMAKTGSL